ncbi:MAG: AAA family ATPase [Spirochaetota bacterium]
MKPVLYIFSGLPGCGKSTLARALAGKTSSAYLRIDTVEQGIRELCSFDVQGEGYRLAYEIAADNLLIGNSVVADSCNPWVLTRREWENVAVGSGAAFVNIEVVCSDAGEHKQRVESRLCAAGSLILPSWEDVLRREYHAWDEPHCVIDTAGRTAEECLRELYENFF